MKKITIVIIIFVLLNVSISFGYSNNLIRYVDNDLYRTIEKLPIDSKISLYVWKEPYDIAEYRYELEKLGYNDMIYSNETDFQLLASARNMSDLDIRIEREEYKNSRLLAIKNVIRKSQEKFIKDMNLSYSDIIYIGTYTNTLMGTFTKDAVNIEQ